MKEKDTIQKASAPWLKTPCKYRQALRRVNYWFSGGCWYPVAPKTGLRSLALKIFITIREESKSCYFDPNVLERNQHADILRQDLSTSSRSYNGLFWDREGVSRVPAPSPQKLCSLAFRISSWSSSPTNVPCLTWSSQPGKRDISIIACLYTNPNS